MAYGDDQDPQDPQSYSPDSGLDLTSLMMDPSVMQQMDPSMMAMLMQAMAPQQAQAPPSVAPSLPPLGGESGSFEPAPGPVSLGSPDLFSMGARMRAPYGVTPHGTPVPAAALPATAHHPHEDFTPHGAGDWMRILMPALLGIAGAAVGGPGGAVGAWTGFAKGADEEEKRRMQQQALDQRTAMLQANERRYREMERLRDENNQRLRDATGSQLLDKVITQAQQFNDPQMQAFTLNQHAKELAAYGYDTRTFAPQVKVRAQARLQKWAQGALTTALAQLDSVYGKDADKSPFFAAHDPAQGPEPYVWPTDDGKTVSLRELARLSGKDPDTFTQTLTKLKLKQPPPGNPDEAPLMAAEMASFYKAHPDRDPTPEENADMRANVIQTIARARHITTPEERAEENIFGRTQEAQGRVFDDVPPDEAQPSSAALTSIGTAVRAAKPRLTQIAPEVQGEEFLKLANIPEDTKALIRAVAQGRANIPGGFGGAGLRTEFLALVSRYDPTFDQANPTARIATRKAFTVGPEGKQINALNTLMGHFDALGQAQDAQKNGNVKLVNYLLNSVMTQLGEPETNNYEVVADAVSKEATRVWRGSGGSESDIERYLQAFNSSAGPKIQSGAAAELAQLVESKLHALSDQYEQGMSLTYEPPGGYWDPDTNPTGMKVPPSSWLLRPWARQAMENVYRRAGKELPPPPMPDLIRQQDKVVTPTAPAGRPAPPTPRTAPPTAPAGPAVGPVRGTEPGAPAPDATPPLGLSIARTPQSEAAARQVNALSGQLQQAIRDRRSPQEVAAIRRQLAGAVSTLERMGQ